jgi:hypothetical protein
MAHVEIGHGAPIVLFDGNSNVPYDRPCQESEMIAGVNAAVSIHCV